MVRFQSRWTAIFLCLPQSCSASFLYVSRSNLSTTLAAMANCTEHFVLACRMPMHYVWNWSPFHIDALGLVTLIGAEQVNAAVGRLVSSRYTEFLPLLGAYVIAGNSFTDAYSGFAIYNISAGIMTTDLAGWFTRWCLAQDFSRGCSSITWTVQEGPSGEKQRERQVQSRIDTSIALLVGVVANGFLLAFTILQGDWWGLANAVSMVVSIAVRWYLIKKNRDAIDAAVNNNYGPNSADRQPAKCFITFNDGKQINMYAPQKLVKAVFIDKPAVNQRSWLAPYFVMRMVGWIGFSAHVITIGMSGLATQIVTVFIIVVSTAMTVFKFGCKDNLIGSKLHAEIRRPGPGESERRQDAFIDLGLTDAEEGDMKFWNQMPLENGTAFNNSWWIQYRTKKADWWRSQNPQPAPSGSLASTIQVPNVASKAPSLKAVSVSSKSVVAV